MSLKQGTLGWKQVAGLGISLVIAGQFTGWNYGLANGWTNMVIATFLMAVLCFGLALCVTELCAAEPSAGGLYVYCESAFGTFVGYFIGFAIFAALAISTGAAATFISAYCRDTLGIGGWPLKLVLIAAILGLHLRGIGEAMRWMVAAGVLSLLCIFVFIIAMAPHFQFANLSSPALSLTPSPARIFAAVPFAIWLFISVEQTAAASEEAADPARTMPRGILAAILTLLVSAVGILLFAAGGGGIERVAGADAPLYAALTSPLAGPLPKWLATLVGLGGVMGLVATMFSLTYAASRQLYALARDGHLPAFLASTNRRGAPTAALVIVALIGSCTSTVQPDRILLSVVLSLSMSYVVLLAAFIRIRITRPELERPFRVPGGIAVAGTCMALAALVLVGCFQVDAFVLAGLGTLFTAAILANLFMRHRRHVSTTHVQGTSNVP